MKKKKKTESQCYEGILWGFMPDAKRVCITGKGKGQNFGSLSIYELTRHISLKIQYRQNVYMIQL